MKYNFYFQPVVICCEKKSGSGLPGIHPVPVFLGLGPSSAVRSFLPIVYVIVVLTRPRTKVVPSAGGSTSRPAISGALLPRKGSAVHVHQV